MTRETEQLLDALLDLEFISADETRFAKGATEKQLLAESCARALSRFDTFYASTDKWQTVDWTNDASVVAYKDKYLKGW